MKGVALLLIAGLFLFLQTYAQVPQYTFSRLDVSGGLSHNQVNTIHKDKHGFLWFGTMSGLNRYDGYSVKTFRSSADSTSLIDNYISNIWECPGDKLWVASRAQISVFDCVTEKFSRNSAAYLQSLGLPPGTIVTIKKDSEKNYWFVYQDSGIFVVANGKTPQRIVHDPDDPSSISSNTISSIAGDNRGNIWLMHQNGLLEKMDPALNRITGRIDLLQKPNAGSFNYQLFIDGEDEFWVWAPEPKGVYHINSKQRLIAFNESSAQYKLNNNLVNGVVQGEDSRIWIATDHGGINLVDKARNYAVTYLVNDPENNKTVAQNSINALYRDANGIIWAGTYKQGVSYYNENLTRFAHYRHKTSDKTSLQYDDVNRFVEDKHGNIWIGTNGGGLIYFDRRTEKFTQYLHNPADPNSLSNNVIVSLCIDHEEQLWIGTYLGGLNRFDGRKFIRYRHNDSIPGSLSEDRVWEILEDSQHNLWVGTLGKGVDKFDRRTGEFIHFPVSGGNTANVQSGFIMTLLEDRVGNLWIGTAGGVDVLDRKTNKVTHYGYSTTPGSLNNNNVIAMLEDHAGRIWIGTREGLNLFNRESGGFRSFTKADGLSDNTVLTILEDNQHTLWITSPNGLTNLKIEGDDDSGIRISSVKNYDESSNLQGREFNENAALKTRAGELVIGGPNGFNILNLAYQPKAQPVASVVLTGFQVFNENVTAGDRINGRAILKKAISATGNVTLGFSENVFSLEFAALDFSHSSGEKYAYMLDGFSKDWLYTDGRERKATYTNLDPGSYTFRVKALNADGVWSPETQLQVTVLPPFWRTPLAIGIYIIGIAGLLVLARKIIVDRTKMRYEVAQQRREADRMHALDAMKTKFFTNVSHEFRTPLSLILSPLDKILKNTPDAGNKAQLQLIQRNARRLLQLINQLLDFREMEVQQFVLHPSLYDIVRFTKDISYSFTDLAEQKNITFAVSSGIDQLETYFDKDKLEKILFNLLSNAFKYTPANGDVRVSMRLAGHGSHSTHGSFEIMVKDTGIGIPSDKHEKIFERFFQHDVPESMLNQGTGIGLAITREFVRLHEGTVRVESEPDKGTAFIVTLPVRTGPALAATIEDPQPAAATTANSAANFAAAAPALQPPPVNAAAPPAAEKRKAGRLTILVIEDNEDFRFYLKDNLKQKYHVEEAADGKTGLQKLRQLHPDLVVSDIMMPGINGIELAKRLKNDPRTASIPVILLTAMDSDEAKLEGYQAGVNDYIAKPFTFEILESRIKNILGQQKQLKENIQRRIEINPADTAVSSADEQFMKLAQEAVERNLSNAGYSVEDLSRDLFMSRVATYKKILSLTRKTPIEFIRTMRLKRGAQLLAKSRMTVAEVAYEVGFNNPKNFSRYFKDEFDMLPSQYQKQEAGQAAP